MKCLAQRKLSMRVRVMLMIMISRPSAAVFKMIRLEGMQ